MYEKTTVDEEEAMRLAVRLMNEASPEYLNPGPELHGKYMVCKNYQFLVAFDTEDEAMDYAAKHEPGSLEIRCIVSTNDGVSTRVIVPGAIWKSDE